MKTLQEEWDSYVAACYPDGVPALQLKECRQAFMAGCMSQGLRYLEVSVQVVERVCGGGMAPEEALALYRTLTAETIEEARPR